MVGNTHIIPKKQDYKNIQSCTTVAMCCGKKYSSTNPFWMWGYNDVDVPT